MRKPTPEAATTTNGHDDPRRPQGQRTFEENAPKQVKGGGGVGIHHHIVQALFCTSCRTARTDLHRRRRVWSHSK